MKSHNWMRISLALICMIFLGACSEQTQPATLLPVSGAGGMTQTTDTPIPTHTLLPTFTPVMELTRMPTYQVTGTHTKIVPGPVITKENAGQIVLLGSIPLDIKINGSGRFTPAWSNDSQTIAIAGNKGVRFIDPFSMIEKEYLEIENPEPMVLTEPKYEETHDLDYNPDGNKILIATNYHLWEFDIERKALIIIDIAGQTFSATYGNTGQWIIVGAGDGCMIYDGKTYMLKKVIDCWQSAQQLSFSPNDTYLAIFPKATSVQIRKTGTWEQLPTPSGGNGGTVRFSPDGKYLAIGTTLLNVDSWTIRKELGGDNDHVEYVDFSHDGKLLFSIREKGVDIWDVNLEGKLFSKEWEFMGKPYNLSVSPDGRFLATIGYDNTLRLWGVPENQTG
jgi:hypothetical protein